MKLKNEYKIIGKVFARDFDKVVEEQERAGWFEAIRPIGVGRGDLLFWRIVPEEFYRLMSSIDAFMNYEQGKV